MTNQAQKVRGLIEQYIADGCFDVFAKLDECTEDDVIELVSIFNKPGWSVTIKGGEICLHNESLMQAQAVQFGHVKPAWN